MTFAARFLCTDLLARFLHHSYQDPSLLPRSPQKTQHGSKSKVLQLACDTRERLCHYKASKNDRQNENQPVAMAYEGKYVKREMMQVRILMIKLLGR
jgi:hypothetical protein